MTEPTPHAQKKKHSRQMATSCESCGNFVYDEDYECYTCEVDLDEDEMARFLQDKFYNCPYYQLGDEYRIVLQVLHRSPEWHPSAAGWNRCQSHAAAHKY